MRHLLRIALPLAVMLGLLTACGSGFKLGGIQVELEGVAPSAKPGVVELSLHFQNENDIAIGVTETVHKLYLNGNFAGKLRNEDPVGLKPLGQGKLKVLLKLDKPAELRALAARGSASYRLDSEVIIMSGEEKLSLSSRSEGQVDLSALR